MLTIQYYDVRITSSEGEIVLRRIDNATAFSFEYSNNQSNIEFTVNITVFILKDKVVIRQLLLRFLVCKM